MKTKYVLLTAARNEESLISQTIESVVNQTILPQKWIIINDNSADGTEDIVRHYAQRYSFIYPFNYYGNVQRNFGGKVRALQAGFNELQAIDYDFIGILDADISLPPNYYESLLSKFQEDPQLGLAGGYIYEAHNGVFKSRPFNRRHSVPAGIQLFRRACYEQLGGHLPLPYGGEDWHAEVTARMHGWKVSAFPEFPAYHHRLTATAEGILKGRFRQGKMAYSLGTHPLWAIMRSILRLGEKPYVVGAFCRFAGYLWSMLKREKRLVSQAFIKYFRAEETQIARDRLREIMTQIRSIFHSGRPATKIQLSIVKPKRTVQSFQQIRKLTRFALQGLKYMQLDSGLFCVEKLKDEPLPRGCSLRYSIMTLLGLRKAALNHYEIGFNLQRIEQAIFSRIDSPELRTGDLGLLLWYDSLYHGESVDDLMNRITRLISQNGGPGALEGQEIAWLTIGLSHASLYHDSEPINQLFGAAVKQLLHHNRAPSGLFYHHGKSHLRRRFPNFATQIYGLLALTLVAMHHNDPRALAAAKATADSLLALQLPHGGWPWIFDAEKGQVVEPYEIYSVHQDAMAPMALLSLYEMTHEVKYLNAAFRGLQWIYGHNELNYQMISPSDHMIYRSIRRQRKYARLALHANVARAMMGKHYNFVNHPNHLEINLTCRPYHLGWILEAWCGRESIGQKKPKRKTISVIDDYLNETIPASAKGAVVENPAI